MQGFLTPTVGWPGHEQVEGQVDTLNYGPKEHAFKYSIILAHPSLIHPYSSWKKSHPLASSFVICHSVVVGACSLLHLLNATLWVSTQGRASNIKKTHLSLEHSTVNADRPV